MNDRDRGFPSMEESLLAAARRAHEPTAQDAARVLQATRSAIAALPAGSESAVLGAGKGGGAALATKLIAGAFAIAAVSGGIGYQLGMSAGSARDQHAARAPVAAQVSSVPVSVAARPAIAPVEQAAAPAVPAPAAQARENVRARAQQPRGPHLEPPVAAQPELAPVSEPAAALPLGSLEAEVRALERVQRALRDRAPAEALALLQKLDRDVPQGRLGEERSAARALARCELGQGEPLAHALEFSQRFPASVYFTRVRKTCMDAAKNAH